MSTLAGLSRHGQLPEEHRFERVGDLSIVVGFLVTGDLVGRILSLIAAEGFILFYLRLLVD